MSSDPNWVRIARTVDLTGPGPFTAWAGTTPLVVVRSPAGLRAFDGRCPHRGALLGEGEIEDGALVCRNHRWRFAVDTGRRDGGQECLSPCALRETEGALEADTSPRVSGEGGPKTLRDLSDLAGPPSLPLLGIAHLIELDELHLQLEGWGKKYGTPYAYRFGSIDVLVVSESETMDRVLRERPARFRRTSSIEPIFRELGVAGVFSAEGDTWKPQRKLSMEALSHRHLRGFYPTLAKVTERLRERWIRAAERGEALDVSEELKRFTVDVTTLLVFGYDINTLEKDHNVIQDKLELIFPTFARRINSIVPWWRILRLPKDRRVDRAVKELWQWIAGLVGEARRALEADPARAERPRNFLEAMVAAKDDAGKPFDDETILGNAMTMLLAGEDTTAYTLAWAVHHLLDAPGEVSRLQAEADAVLGSASVPKDIEAANRLPYAGAVANEAMRMRPVAPVFFLEACEDTTVADVRVPKGTWIVLLLRSQAVDAKNFALPAEFRPSRWLAPEGAHEPGANQPFGSGPRICPGRSLALLEMKVMLAMLYQSFSVERVGASADVREIFSFTMKPSELKVRLKPRVPSASVPSEA